MPPVEHVAVGFERGRPFTGRDPHVIDEGTRVGDHVIGDHSQRDPHVLPGVLRQVDGPPLEGATVAESRVPPTGGPLRHTRRVTGPWAHVVRQEGVEVQPEGTGIPGVTTGVPALVLERRPVVLTHRVCLDGEGVPARLRPSIDREGQRGSLLRHADGAHQALVSEARRLRHHQVVAGPGLRERLEEAGVDGVHHLDVPVLVPPDIPPSDARGRQVGGHRLLSLPVPRRPAVDRLAVAELAVRDDRTVARSSHPERVGGLVRRVVVHREPGRSDLRFTDHQSPVRGVDETGAIGQRLRHAAVADDRREQLTPTQLPRRSDPQLAAVARPAGGPSVDLHRQHLQAVQVEIEPRQVLGRPRLHCCHAGEAVGPGPVGQVKRVVPGVVAAIAVLGEVRIPDPRRTGMGGAHRRRTSAGGDPANHEQE